MKQILFFALREDLLSLLELVDNKGPHKYARMGNFPQAHIKDGISVFDNGAEIPNLGVASADVTVHGLGTGLFEI